MARMFDSCLVRQCAPTLAGVKVGNLFCLEIADGVLLCNILARWNKALNVKGVFARVLAEKNGRYYIYVYRDCELERLSKIGEVQSFLKGFGYAEFDVESLLKFFKVRMAKSACFPHEVGVFLGYPLDDVRDFIVYGGKNYKRIGCWKVYNDVPNSMHIFEVYKKCQKIMADMFERGVSLERLTVAS
ncbi:MAG: DUF3793 family protein [Fibrobacter sp.]|nr:DUF3793 family protein [Fibrobacter sp.]